MAKQFLINPIIGKIRTALKKSLRFFRCLLNPNCTHKKEKTNKPMLRKKCYRRKDGQTDRAKFFGLPGDMEKVLQKVVQN